MKYIIIAVIASIMAFRTIAGGNLRLSVWDGKDFRSGLIVRGTQPYRFFREHVSRDSERVFLSSDAITVSMEFSGDTIKSIR